jgi:hypothetical protein
MELSLLVKVLLSNAEPPPDMVQYVCDRILSFLLQFFEKHMEKLSSCSNIHPDAKKICNALMDATYLLYTNENAMLLAQEKGEVDLILVRALRLIKAMKSRDILV